MSQTGTAPAPKHAPHSIGFNLGVIAVLVGLGAMGLAYLIDAAGRGLRPVVAESTVSRTIGATTLTIPAGWMSPDDHSTAGFAREVDLRLPLPLGPAAAPVTIDIALMPRSRVRPSASLLDGVYLHQFMPEQLTGPPGLVGKPMVASDGYEGETVWYDPINPQPFVAKCSAPVAVGAPGRCLRAVYLNANVAAVYGFDDVVLANWSAFDAAMAQILDRIGSF